MKLRCNICGDPVTDEVPEDTVVKAWLICPNCEEKGKPKTLLSQNFTKEEFLKLK
jgi:hypothetical protein